jgi:hypothetical protein
MGGRVLSFTDVAGDEEEFFRTYFNKRVSYRPGGITGDPRQILSIADMDDIVHQEGQRCGGRETTRTPWTLCPIPFSTCRFSRATCSISRTTPRTAPRPRDEYPCT